MAELTDQQRQQLAAQGLAMSDGSFPIRNKADLARAIMAFGRASNPMAVKTWILKRAQALDAMNLLPPSWQ